MSRSVQVPKCAPILPQNEPENRLAVGQGCRYCSIAIITISIARLLVLQ